MILTKPFINTLSWVFGLQSRQRLSILIYHRVMAEPDYMRSGEPTVEKFDWQMESIAKHFCPLSLEEALHLIDAGKLPQRAICVTFDDGYADNALLALPVLKKWAVPATVFVSTSFLDGGIMWNDKIIETFRRTSQENMDLTEFGLGCYTLDTEESRHAAACKVLTLAKHLEPELRDNMVSNISKYAEQLPENLMLTSAQVLGLHEQGVEIAAHTATHPILTSICSDTARQEISMSKNVLENIIQRRVRYFAYPNGVPEQDYANEHVSIVKKLGFDAAFSTSWGVSDKATDRFQMPRFTPWDDSPGKFMTRLLLNERLVAGSEGAPAA